MTRLWIASVLAAGLAAGALQETGEGRLIPLRIVDQTGNPVAGLTAADVDVLVDGRPVTVTSLAPRGALSLAVVADTTRSAGWGRTGWLAPPTGQVFAALAGMRDDDRLRFGSFGPRVTFRHPWQALAGRKLPEEWEGILDADDEAAAGPSPIWDVIHDAVTMLGREPAPRALLLMTDGRSTGNARSLDEAAEHASAHDVTIHSIVRYLDVQFPQGDNIVVAVRPWAGLHRLALYTGGSAVAYPMNESVQGLDLAEKLGRSIRDAYQVGFADPGDGATHKLEIRAKRPGVKILAPLAFLSSKSR